MSSNTNQTPSSSEKSLFYLVYGEGAEMSFFFNVAANNCRRWEISVLIAVKSIFSGRVLCSQPHNQDQQDFLSLSFGGSLYETCQSPQLSLTKGFPFLYRLSLRKYRLRDFSCSKDSGLCISKQRRGL